MADFRILIVFTAASQYRSASAGACTPVMASPDSDPAQKKVWITSTGATGSVTINGTTYVTYPCDDTTSVNVGQSNTPDFVFTVWDATGSTPSNTAYQLGGMALKTVSGAVPAGTAFPTITIESSGGVSTLTAKDKNNGASGQTTTYDFWLLVQNVAAGSVGLVDPRIVNAS